MTKCKRCSFGKRSVVIILSNTESVGLCLNCYKGLISWLKELKQKQTSLEKVTCPQCEIQINIPKSSLFISKEQHNIILFNALADQKAEIRKWLKHRDSRNDIMKEFEDLKL